MRIAVVGDGIVGTAIAFFLKHSGANIVLVGPSGSGARSATEVSGGLLRVVDPDRALATVAKRGVMVFRHWRELGLPGQCGYSSCGAVLLAPQNDGVAFEKLANELSSEDYPIGRVSSEAFGDKFPMLCLPEGAQAFHEPFGGYGSPPETRDSLLSEFVRLGGEYKRSRVEKLGLSSSSEIRIMASDSQLGYDVVVVAAGRGTTELFGNSGLTLTGDSAISPKTIAIPHLRKADAGEITDKFPILVDMLNGTFLRPIGNNDFIVGAGNDGEFVGVHDEPSLQTRHIVDAQKRISQTIRGLSREASSQGNIGVDAYTPQNRPVVGFMPMYPSVFVASGFSGRGYKISMPIAASIARNILKTAATSVSELTSKISISPSLLEALVVSPEYTNIDDEN